MPELIGDKNDIYIIKRDGRKEIYSEEKLRKVIDWASDGSKRFSNKLFDNFNIKIVNGMSIINLYDELINTAVNMITNKCDGENWDEIAKRLYLMKLYKETSKLKRIGNYPHLQNYINKGLKNKIYDYNIFKTFDEQEIDELNTAIDANRDLIFNYKGLKLFYDKYCKSYLSEDKKIRDKLELPQITYMVSAMHTFYNIPIETSMDRKRRIKLIIKCYDLLSTHCITFSTPRNAFAGTETAQFASCVLMTMADDSKNILETLYNCGIYSKFSGGISVDFSYLRASGAPISRNDGVSSGPIPFIKAFEEIISSFNQQGKRAGSGIVYFPWWHLDVMNLLMLKDEGGVEELRARKLKYCIKLDGTFIRKVINNEYITLFDPMETIELIESYGEEFDKFYKAFEKNGSFRTKRIKARDLAYLMIKIRSETGNLYVAFMDNINEQNMTNRLVTSSNLCVEVVVPSRPSKRIEEKRYINDKNKNEVHVITESGEIGLCNLSSINSLKWLDLNDKDKDDLIYNLMLGMDNIIDSQFYPVKDGEYSNKKYRPIGIGITDFANALAFNQIKFTDKKAIQFTNDLMDDIYYRVYKTSMELAKERGPFDGFKNSLWAKGETPFSISKFRKKYVSGVDNVFGLELDEKKWFELGENIEKFGVRFSLHSSIPPSATSGKVTNSTESCEPIMGLSFIESGTHNLPTVVKGKGMYDEYYETCWEIPNRVINILAAVRQMYLDQSQSFNHYNITTDSAYDTLMDIINAYELGIKTIYYLKTPKAGFELNKEEVCESCSV